MITNIVAECWDARYEEDMNMLLIFCYLRDSGLKRVLPIRRTDIPFHGQETPHEEMYRTAELWKGKPFNLQIEDNDPEEQGEELFGKERFMIGDISSQMMEIADKMSSDEWIMQFKMDRLMGKR